MILYKIYWASARLLFLFLVMAGIFTAGLFIYLTGPVFSWYFHRDWHFGRYRHLVFPTVLLSYCILADWIKNPGYRSSFLTSLTASPRSAPDNSKVRVRPDWPMADGTCNGCIQCCTKRACTMIDKERNICLSYDSFYWRYFNCGRYPESPRQIEYYNCPKWEIIG
ncbi:MAG: hypothetical protein NTX43_13725 [Bacteroidetes bacterium]|nr:hypothetical protein [Bacteroidota bacterium]